MKVGGLMSCNCLPSNNLVCGPVITSIGVYQSDCQLLPSNEIVVNPYYDQDNNRSYFTYSFLLDCDGPILEVYFLVCENIDSQLIIDYRVQSCGYFVNTEYSYQNPPNVFPPPGLRYVRVVVNGAYDPGVAVVYRLSILGNYINDTRGSIAVMTRGGLSLYTNPYIIPGCNDEPQVSVGQDVVVDINENKARLLYRTIISNTGDSDLTNLVMLNDISYDQNVIIGDITTIPDNVEINILEELIELSLRIPLLPIGQSMEIYYDIPLDFEAPGTYDFISFVLVAEEDSSVMDTAITETSMESVELNTNIICNTDEDTIELCINIANIQGSPTTRINVFNMYTLFEDYTVEFLSFGGCQGQFSNGNIVETNVPIQVNDDIMITCLDMLLTENTTLRIEIKLRILDIGLDIEPLPRMELYLNDISIMGGLPQVLIQPGNIPKSTGIDTFNSIICNE